MRDARPDELLQADDAQEVAEQPDRGPLALVDDLLAVDRGIGDAVPGDAHLAVDDGLTRDEHVKVGLLISGRSVRRLHGHVGAFGTMARKPKRSKRDRRLTDAADPRRWTGVGQWTTRPSVVSRK